MNIEVKKTLSLKKHKKGKGEEKSTINDACEQFAVCSLQKYLKFQNNQGGVAFLQIWNFNQLHSRFPEGGGQM